MTQRLLWPLTRLGETFDLYQRAMASTIRILDLLGIKSSIIDGDIHLPTADVRGKCGWTRWNSPIATAAK